MSSPKRDSRRSCKNGPCQHCGRVRWLRPRDLCWKCYTADDIREQYPSRRYAYFWGKPFDACRPVFSVGKGPSLRRRVLRALRQCRRPVRTAELIDLLPERVPYPVSLKRLRIELGGLARAGVVIRSTGPNPAERGTGITRTAVFWQLKSRIVREAS